MVRRTVLYSGRVQGVGFRYTTCHIAAGYEVTGYVRNLRDGRVELLAEGEPEELNRFLGEIETRMSGHIWDKDESDFDATGEFDGFMIR